MKLWIIFGVLTVTLGLAIGCDDTADTMPDDDDDDDAEGPSPGKDASTGPRQDANDEDVDATPTKGKDGGTKDAGGAGKDTECFFNADCQKALRCECDDTTGCSCQPGTRGTGAAGAPCANGNDCASSISSMRRPAPRPAKRLTSARPPFPSASRSSATRRRSALPTTDLLRRAGGGLAGIGGATPEATSTRVFTADRPWHACCSPSCMTIPALSFEDRKQVLRFAASFLWADLEVAEQERHFLDKLARELDIPASADDLRELLSSPPLPEEIHPTCVPPALADVVRQTALRAIAADGKVEASEMILFELLDDLLPRA